MAFRLSEGDDSDVPDFLLRRIKERLGELDEIQDGTVRAFIVDMDNEEIIWDRPWIQDQIWKQKKRWEASSRGTEVRIYYLECDNSEAQLFHWHSSAEKEFVWDHVF